MGEVISIKGLQVTIKCPHCSERVTINLFPPSYKDYRSSHYYNIPVHSVEGEGEWWYGVCCYCRSYLLVKNGDEIICQKSANIHLDSGIPDHIVEDLEEALECLRNKAYKACILMTRHVIKSAVAERGIKNKSLVEYIASLDSDDLIPEDFKKWINIATWLDGAGRKGGSSVSHNEAENIVNFVNKLLKVIYTDSQTAFPDKETVV